MPTSSLIPAMQGSPIQLAYPASYRPNDVMIHAFSWQALGAELAGIGGVLQSNTYPAANRALGFMFAITEPFPVRKVFWVNGTTATTDSADVAVYREDGATRLVSGGGTAIATANAVQEVDCTDTLLAPGRYWCVYNQNGVTATGIGLASNLNYHRLFGWAQFAGAVPLGTTFTPAAPASQIMPLFGISSRTQVA